MSAGKAISTGWPVDRLAGKGLRPVENDINPSPRQLNLNVVG
jgi:hypothetical protein